MRIASISIQAELDIDQIWTYIAADNVTAADRYIDQIGVRSQSYANQPELGETRLELGDGIRCFTIGNYVVYYRPTPLGIEIARVLHGARDVHHLCLCSRTCAEVPGEGQMGRSSFRNQ